MEDRRGKTKCPGCRSILYAEWREPYPGGGGVIRGKCRACGLETVRAHTEPERRKNGVNPEMGMVGGVDSNIVDRAGSVEV